MAEKETDEDDGDDDETNIQQKDESDDEEMEEEEKINKPVDKYDRGFSSSLKFQTHEKCF